MNDDSSKTEKITMRTWYGLASPRPGYLYSEEISRELYGVDMVQNREWGEIVHHWDGEDRDGSPLHVAWLPAPRFGVAALYAYEISGGE